MTQYDPWWALSRKFTHMYNQVIFELERQVWDAEEDAHPPTGAPTNFDAAPVH